MTNNKTAEQAAEELNPHDYTGEDDRAIIAVSEGWGQGFVSGAAWQAQQQAVNPWVKASERLPDMYDQHERHYRLDGNKSNGLLITEHPIAGIVFEYKTPNGWEVVTDLSRVYWLDESLLSSQPAPVVNDIPVAPTPIDLEKMALELYPKKIARQVLGGVTIENDVNGNDRRAFIKHATAVLERMREREGKFAEWASENGWLIHMGIDCWSKPFSSEYSTPCTTADLYAQYKKEVGK